MSQATMTYVLAYVRANVSNELLQLAFKPRKFATTIESRIISEVIEGQVLLDTNLVGGKRRGIFLSSDWAMPLAIDANQNLVGPGLQGAYYKIPPEAREGRNIAAVIDITNDQTMGLPGSSVNYNGTGGFGNTVPGLLNQMLNTRTMAQYANAPEVTLEGTNIIRVYPQELIGDFTVTVMLEYDSEFVNMERSAVFALRELCLCAVQRYIATQLRVSIDETEVVAGMEIGVIKDMVVSFQEKGEQYDTLLRRFKGAMHADTRSINRMIYNML